MDADLTGYTVLVTFSQGAVKVTKEAESTVSGNVSTLQVSLTQEETGQFAATKMVQIQANWYDETGLRGATEFSYDIVFENLLKRVVPTPPAPPTPPAEEVENNAD